MTLLPDALLQTFVVSAMLFSPSAAQAASEPQMAPIASNEPIIPSAPAPDAAQVVMALKRSPAAVAPPNDPRGSAPSLANMNPALSGPVLSEERLGSLRGGTDITTTEATLSAAVTGNVATSVLTGSNTIDAGSFANMTGIPVVIQNTGANVLIQNATVINLQMK